MLRSSLPVEGDARQRAKLIRFAAYLLLIYGLIEVLDCLALVVVQA